MWTAVTGRPAQLVLGLAAPALITAGALWAIPDVVERYPFVLVLPSVFVSARFGGFVAGTVATIASALFLRTPWLASEFERAPQTTYTALVLFICMGLLISLVHGRLLSRERDLAHLATLERQRSQDLSHSLAALRQSEKAKDEFLAILSHELRTPLNVVLGYNRMLRHTAATEQQHRYVDLIERNAIAQMRLVEDLLDMQRILHGRLTLERTTFHLERVGRAVVESLRPQCEAKQLHCVYNLEPSQINGDAARIQQVLWNLLANAIKFTPPGGCVALHGVTRNEHVLIHVQDSGVGIAPDFLPHVFERFRQFDTSQTRRHFGMGLGLAIVKEIVELHGGTVRAESAGIGTGATFTVTLPREMPGDDGAD